MSRRSPAMQARIWRRNQGRGIPWYVVLAHRSGGQWQAAGLSPSLGCVCIRGRGVVSVVPGDAPPVRIVRDGSPLLGSSSGRKQHLNRRQTMAKRDHPEDKDQDLDPAGAHGRRHRKIVLQGRRPSRRRRVTSAATRPSTAGRPAAAHRGRTASTASAPAPRATPRRSTGGAIAILIKAKLSGSFPDEQRGWSGARSE